MGPPWSVLTGNALFSALVNAGIVDAQVLVDRIHRAVSMPDPEPVDDEAPWDSWRNDDTVPTPVANSTFAGGRLDLPRSTGEPFLAGRSYEDQIVVSRYGNGEEFALQPARQ